MSAAACRLRLMGPTTTTSAALRTRLLCCREGYEDFDKYGQRGMVSDLPGLTPLALRPKPP